MKIFFVVLFLLIGVYAYSQVPQSPILISPPDSSIVLPNNVLLDWSDVPTATSYRVQVSFNPSFSALLIDETTNISQYTIPFNVGSSWLYWRVYATNQYGTSLWSTVWSFHTGQAAPPTPLLICDTANVPLTPILDWNNVPSAMSYRVQVSASPTFTSTIINAVVNVSQYKVPSGILNYSSHYYWRVNATNTGGTSPWSPACSFNTIVQSGIGIISSEFPTENKLYNNYPNPFNPKTKIRFDIPRWRGAGGWIVLLKVYDIMGREVQTLVNEKLQPGTYETTFDGSNLNSGIYFYQMVSGDFKQTRKLILLK